MKTKLFPYQQKIVDNEKYKKGVALFMSMGCGKTITSLALAEQWNTKKLLIICLISKMSDWQDDVKKELNIDGVILNKSFNKKAKVDNDNCYIVNFESAWRTDGLLEWVDKDTCILIDESHHIKNPTSKIGRFCDKLRKKTNYKIILTGTPQSKGYIDYYNQLKFVDILDVPYKVFTETYCVYDTQRFNGFPVKRLIGYKNEDLIEKIIKDNCVFFERSVDNDLIPSDIDVKLPTPKYYKTFKKTRIIGDYVADNSAKMFSGLRSLCSGFAGGTNVPSEKEQWFKDFIDDINTRVVVFYNFNNERDKIIDILTKLKIPYSEYNGRVKNLDNFKQHTNGVAVCQYLSASTGLNDLVCSNVCVMYSPPLNYTDWIQAKKRIDRIGQTNKPLYYNLYCKDTVEENILDTMKKGLDFDNNMINDYLLNLGIDK